MTAVAPPATGTLEARTAAVAAVAARHAGAVDAAGAFPEAALAAAREHQLLSAAVPRALGGDGASLVALVDMGQQLGAACASTAMVLAMHHIQVALLARHGMGVPALEAHLERVGAEQRLSASVTSEVGGGGDTRSSVCALEVTGDRFAVVKDATTISYGAQADDLLLTARRAPDAASGDQVLVLLAGGDYTLEPRGGWDMLGMRGTCSPPFLVRGGGPLAHRFPCAYAEASMETMVPVSHLVWAGLWTGIAADAVGRAAAFVRAAARRAPGTVPPTAVRLAEARAQLDALRQLVHGVAAEVDAMGDDRAPLRTVAWALRLNNLKISASEAVPRLVHQALQVIGIAGYRNDSPYAVGRHYRDALSASLMVGNERILARNASLLLVHKDD